MKGSENNVSTFMSAISRFYIPCYQRPYSWTEAQCRTLFDDMVHLHEQQQRDHDTSATHFIGSVVCQKTLDSQSEILVIDGQQRLTTMYLFYLALYRLALRHAESQVSAGSAAKGDVINYASLAQAINIQMLTDKTSSFTYGAPIKHRFKLTDPDQDAMNKLFTGNEDEFDKDSLLTSNYHLFLDLIAQQENMTLGDFFKITESVLFIQIELAANDDAQLIFESLNSKGLDLSEGDKVRNFLLMGFSQDQVDNYYQELWRPMEKNCQGELSEFIQYYLAIKYGRSPSMRSLYLDFKDYVLRTQNIDEKVARENNLNSDNKIKIPTLNDTKVKVMEDLFAYAQLFSRIRSSSFEMYSNCDTELSPKARADLQAELSLSLQRLEYLNYSVRIPVVMQCMMLHRIKKISGTELLAVFKVIETFLFRRWACGVPSHGLNRMFQALSSSFDPKSENQAVSGAVLNRLVSFMCAEDKSKGVSSMPNDDTFIQALQERDLYSNSRNREAIFYMFERLENADTLEQVKIDASYSIEHIMPQKLSEEWREELGPDAEEIHKTWLHRMANMTLTAYNGKYSNSSFADKCSMDHGFASSPLRINREIAEFGHWGPQEMKWRADLLIAKAIKIWPYPSEAKETTSKKSTTTFEAFDYNLADGERELTGCKLNGYEFMGQHYDAKNWSQLQQAMFTQLYHENPERMRSWLTQPWGNFNWLKQFLKDNPDFAIAKKAPWNVIKVDDGVYISTSQNVVVKLKMLHQLFEMMEIDRSYLTLHLVRGKPQD